MTPTSRRVLVSGAVVAGISLGLIAESSWNATVDPRIVIADAAAGWTFLLGGIAAWNGRPTSAAGRLMVAVGLAWFAGTMWPSLEFLHRGPLVHLVATYPTGQLAWRGTGRADRLRLGAVLAAYAANLTRLGGLAPVALAFGTALLAIGGEAILGSGRGIRRARLSASLVALALGAVVLVAAVAPIVGMPLGVSGLLAYDVVLTVGGLILALDLLAGRWAEGLLTRAIVDLGDASLAGTVRDRLARLLGDPSLVLAYSVPEDGSFVDEVGVPVARPRPGRMIRPIVVDGREMGFIAHDAAVTDDPRLVRSLLAAAGLAMSNSRTQSSVRARVADIEASRERLVHAADTQRRRLERLLEAGASRRLERVAELLDDVKRADPAAVVAIDSLAADLARARGELADFARGIHPAALATGGLAAALEDLVGRTPLPVDLTIVAEPADALTESTLYFVCSEALANATKHARATRIAIDVRQTAGTIRLMISDDGVGGARLTAGGGLRGLADRIEALGGTFEVRSRPGAGTRIRVQLRSDVRTGGTTASSAGIGSPMGGAG